MIKVSTEILIKRTADEVFQFISNFENNPKWQSGQLEARITSEGPIGVGSTYDQVAKFLGRQILSTFEVLEFEAGRRVKASSTSGSFPITFTRIVEPADVGAKVSAVIEGDSSGFFKIAEPLMGRMVQRSVEADYKNLKKIMESERRNG